MTSTDYFELLFFGHSLSAPKYSNKKFWAFDQLFCERFGALPGIIATEFSKKEGVTLELRASQDMSLSLENRLRSILGPVFQAEYRSMLRYAEKKELISKKPSKQQEITVRHWFLQVMQREGTARLFDKNAYIKEATLKIINQWLISNRLFCQRLAKDAAKLGYENTAFTPHEVVKITSVRCDLSDPHNGGEAVRIVELANDIKVVYKPRSLAAEQGFYSLVDHLNKRALPKKLHTPWVINKGVYGWMEYCQPVSRVSSADDALNYSAQFGALCAIWYILGGTDLHVENVVFTHKGPVIIDCETVFEADMLSSPFAGMHLKPNLEPGALIHSILSTGALIGYLSDLNPKGETIFNRGGITGLWSLIEQKPAIGPLVSKQSCIDAVCQGIQTVFEYFRSQPVRKTSALVESYFKDDIALRYVLRPTSSYVALMQNLVISIKSLQSLEDARTYVMEQLHKIPLNPIMRIAQDRVRKTETLQLLDLDVPYFSRKLGEHRIHSVGDFDEPLSLQTDFSSFQLRLEWIQDPAFVKSELYLTRLALMPEKMIALHTKIGSDTHNYSEYYKYSYPLYDYLQTAAVDPIHSLSNIADLLQDELQHMNEPDHDFYVAKLNESNIIYQPKSSSYSLFAGLAGKLMFLGIYSVVYNRPDISKFVEDKLAYFLELGKNSKYVLAHSNDGLGDGYPSLLYAFESLQRIGVLKDLPLQTMSEALDPGSHPGNDHDFITAVPGRAMLAALSRDHLSPSQLLAWVDELKLSMRKLINQWDKLKDRQRIGVAHGALGACLAASRLYESHKDPELRLLALSLVKLEMELVGELRDRSDPLGSSNGWCYGRAGRALTYFSLGQAFNMPEFMKKAKKLVSLDTASLQFSNHTLCCGSLGFFAAHLTVNMQNPKYKDRDFRLKLFREFFKNPDLLLHESERKGLGMVPSGLFYGLSGLGVTLLYCLEPENAPAIWMFR